MNNYLIKRLLAAAPVALGLLATTSAQAQHVQWAARLVAVSSQKSDGKDPFSPSQVLGVPNALIRLRQGDTDLIPMGGGHGSSRATYMGGTAIWLASDAIITTIT